MVRVGISRGRVFIDGDVLTHCFVVLFLFFHGSRYDNMVGSIPSNRFNVVGEIERRGRRVQEKIVVETMPKKCTHFVFFKNKK